MDLRPQLRYGSNHLVVMFARVSLVSNALLNGGCLSWGLSLARSLRCKIAGDCHHGLADVRL